MSIATIVPAVELEDVTRTYGAGASAVTALDGVTLRLRPGTFTAIMGPSGSGKTTLMQCAAGLDHPSSGSVRLAGSDLSRMSERALAVLRREHVGFVFQSFNLMPSLTAAQNVALPLRLAGRRPPRRALVAALDRVGLADRAGHRPAELSGGQQQRVAIARALITHPDVIFADEPTGALDTRSSRDVLALLRDTVDQDGRSLVMVTHDPGAAAWADETIFLADGRIVDQLERPAAEEIAERLTAIGA
jgi:putative ABC transport system ATP-binding protein